VGVILDRTRDNDVYLPSFHVHNLLAPFSGISLSLQYSVPHLRQPKMERAIKVVRHKEEYLSAVAFLQEVMPILGSPVLTWGQLVKMHGEYLRQRRDYAVAKYCQHVFLDVILLAHWCGHPGYAKYCQVEAVELMQSWNPPVDVLAWERNLNSLVDRERMQRTLDAELAKHKLQHLPVYELNGEGAAEPITAIYEAAWARGDDPP
jgi:hypothetical protein